MPNHAAKFDIKIDQLWRGNPRKIRASSLHHHDEVCEQADDEEDDKDGVGAGQVKGWSVLVLDMSRIYTYL